MWTLTYRCVYRDYWYDDAPPFRSFDDAFRFGQRIGRPFRIYDANGNLFYAPWG